MRKNIIWVISGLIVLGIIGLTVYQTNATSSNPDLNTEEISNLVSAQYPGQHTEPELSVENGEPVYQMEVTQNQGVYSLKLNGDTGQVIDLTAVEKTAENRQEKETENDTEPAKEDENKNPESNEDTETAEEKTDSNSENQAAENDAVISHEEAMEIAKKEFPGEVTDLEMDSDDDILVYEIEIINGEDEATIEINAYTGNIITMEIDLDD
ncbi:PepSY domain-containing protein [Oceanobacillus sp. FSL W7-1281]|uniref:PepSY domain-containing protein n=1 Tax=Oceanobacillus sp. FSL W7-1281 TaxID=2921698 RepID=UPI0030D928BF